MNKNSAAQAVEGLIQEYGRLVFHTIYGLTNDWEESQDLTQDTFHQALKGIEAAQAKSQGQFQPKAWLLRVALNTVRMQQRRRNLFRFVPFSSMTHKQQDNAGETETISEQAASIQPVGYGANGGESPEAQVAERDAVQRTLAQLSEPLRACLVLSIIGSFSNREIAEMLDLQEAAVRQRLARARKQFQQFYALESGENLIERAETLPNSQGQVRQDTDRSQDQQGRVESRTRGLPAAPLARLDTSFSLKWE